MANKPEHEGYPVPCQRDGIDTGREIGGAMTEALRVERSIKDYRDSISGEHRERPEYDSDDFFGRF